MAQCKYCRKRNLKWKSFAGKHMLCYPVSGLPHGCGNARYLSERRLTASDPKTTDLIRDVKKSGQVWSSYLFNKEIQPEATVKHFGSSGRAGYVGVISRIVFKDVMDLSLMKSTPNAIVVHYYLQRDGSPLEYIIEQEYTLRWFINNMKVLRRDCGEITKLPPRLLPPGDYIVEAADVPAPEEPEITGEFILWSPNGESNPRKVHMTYSEAKKVATEMAERHNQTFYVCRLMLQTSVKMVPKITEEKM